MCYRHVLDADPEHVEALKGLVEVCRALQAGGIDAAEITMTTPGALGVIEQATAQIGQQCLIGVGSVLDAPTARAAILAGAAYIVSPTLKEEVIEMAHRYGKAVVPGALSPTEVLRAWEAGADRHPSPRLRIQIPSPSVRKAGGCALSWGSRSDF